RELAELECEKQAVTLRMEVPEVIARAGVPRSRGRQLLLSLLRRTLDAAPAGGMLEVRAEITAAASTVRINLRPADDQPAPVDTEDDRHGYLAVSRSIAERMGGRVEVTESAGPEH